ncbi:polysaccharide biosynthesis protein [Agrococcus sp. SGAir0287]|uniref:polysaccharide biosynthesis protein n=1 Tax=Agrococcus sp. SGAir0287 TaxID=2070347 RepID=UPI0010CD3E4C|nr:nucleoside-diphosphate sugar epimerase/dehydratase [Agrococcus sp. SGAir0287]QCR19863.1 polysaccharide biosynthesis protein [Agrococcus sp. SGAir0287]
MAAMRWTATMDAPARHDLSGAAARLRSLAERMLLRDGVARPAPAMAGDGLAWAIAVPLAIWLREDLAVGAVRPLGVLGVVALLVLAQLLLGHALGLYRGRHGYGSLEELTTLVGVVAVALVAIGLPTIAFAAELHLPRTAVVIAGPIALLAMGSMRYGVRILLESGHRPAPAAEPALVLGAGYAGTHLVRRMRTDEHSPLRAVGLVDDDPRLRGAVRCGVRVLGTRAELARIVAETGATRLVVAIARADAELLGAIEAQTSALGLEVLVMPPFADMMRGTAQVTDLRRLSIEDIVGRRPIDTDVERVAGCVTGRRVLVTGAGGSIGAELCRQLARWAPAELIMLDRDESALQAVQLDVHGNGLLSTRDVVLADVRDAEAIADIFADRRPEVVFHAAALKHLPMLEQYPDEGWKTNVLGTRAVLAAAEAVGVETFVNISTDKAANPTSVLGHSKRLAERLTAASAARASGRFLSVRFGNVLGSRGSMVPVFAALIEAGGPVTVTHPDVTRYFMSIPEACQLVVQAAAIGSPGEVLILDMGEPVRILDVARRMIAMSGKDVDIVFTGLRPHEKLHEELVGPDEQGARPLHPLITQAPVPPLEHTALDKEAWDARWRRAAASPRATQSSEAPSIAPITADCPPIPALAPSRRDALDRTERVR